MTGSLFRAAALCVVLLAPGSTSAQGAQRLTWTGSVQAASGDYTFGQRTTSVYFATGLTLDRPRFRASLSVPFVAQSEGWVQVVGGGVIPSGGMHRGASSSDPWTSGMMGTSGSSMMGTPQSGSSHAAMGLGDPIARLDFDLLGSRGSQANLRAILAAKAPLAGLASGFGTGEWDFGAGLSTAGVLGGTFLFADAVYWALGDPAALTLRDIVSYGLGAGRSLANGRFGVLGSLLGTTSVAAGIPASLQAGGSVNYRTGTGRDILVSVLTGLSRSAPDVSLGVGWRVPVR